MEAKELRIGNLVLVRTNGKIETIKHLYEDFGMFVAPIPLTEEWLTKLGFERKQYPGNYYYWLQYRGIEFTAFSPFNQVETDNLEATIEYVHQLQNLYFALTGEELEIKE